ncbi:MAG TPA: hypothetical protein VD710_02890 [Nitrososphaeraceae archaeon]|nr:hypothetical protein [Nitrososphaeraceae archaeon]
MSNERTTIWVSKGNHEELMKGGKFGETFDQIIGRILKESSK